MMVEKTNEHGEDETDTMLTLPTWDVATWEGVILRLKLLREIKELKWDIRVGYYSHGQ